MIYVKRLQEKEEDYLNDALFKLCTEASKLGVNLVSVEINSDLYDALKGKKLGELIFIAPHGHVTISRGR